jgi:rhamnose utilization protein RhaD (predicted bifunctional aldolase and dehydrogenase)
MSEKTDYKYVNYLWDNEKAKAMEGDEVALLLYRSNILGADLRITNYGGGNTSCKTIEKDPLTGQDTEVMWIKGSGGDIGSLKRSGLAALYMERLQNLTKVYRGLAHEDEMVALFNHCIFDLDSKAHPLIPHCMAFFPSNT